MREVLAIAYQVWMETRVRFLVAMTALCSLVCFTVLRAPSTLETLRASRPGVAFSFPQVMWFQLFHAYAELFWTVSTVALTIGGLLHESRHGSAQFTLSLPVSRTNVLLGRALTVVALITGLAFLPYLTIPLIALLVGTTYPIAQSLLFGLCLAIGGIFIFGITFLVAHLNSTETGSFVVSLSAFLVLYFLAKIPALRPMDIFDIMSGKTAVSGTTFLMTGSPPWVQLSACAGIGIFAIAIAIHQTIRRDL